MVVARIGLLQLRIGGEGVSDGKTTAGGTEEAGWFATECERILVSDGV